MKPKFVIGIGSQRAGSTLLHRILSECTPIFMHPVKELHYYDTLFDVRNLNLLRSFSKNELNDFKGDLNNLSKLEECYLRTNKILSKQDLAHIDYINLYRPCIMGNEYLGEITPEYMILPEEGIAKMRNDLGGNTKIILIARDPVERFISSVKLLKLYGGQAYNMEKFEIELLHAMENMPTWMKQQDQLNDYENTLNKFSKYFSNILFLSYEQMISDPMKIHYALEQFLEYEIDENKYLKLFDRKINSIGQTGNISIETKNILKERYSKSINFLESYFL